MSKATDEAMERTGSLMWYKALRHPHPQKGAAVSEHERDLPHQMESTFKTC